MPEMKESGIEWVGKIPEKWKVSKIKYHLMRNERRNPGNVQVLSVYREYGIIPKDSRDDNHNVTSEDTSKYKYVKPGVLVINKMKAWQGSMGVSEYEGIVSPAYFVYEFTSGCVSAKYLHYLLRNVYKEEFRRISGGIREGQWDLPSIGFENEYIPIPSLIEQIHIADFLDSKCTEIDVLTADIQKEIDVLEEYKCSIVTEAVTKGINPNVLMKDSGIEWIGEMAIVRGDDRVNTCRLKVSRYDLNKLKLPIPPIADRIKIVTELDAKCSEADNIISNKREQLAILEDYKKSVIYEYVTGKKEVPLYES